MFMMYTFCRSELLYTKYIQDVCIAKRIPPFLYFLYTKFMQNVYKYLYTKCSTFRQRFVYKIHTKCLYTKCTPYFENLLYTFCKQNLAGIVLLILYIKCIQKFVEMRIDFVDNSCIHLVVYKMCTQFPCGDYRINLTA